MAEHTTNLYRPFGMKAKVHFQCYSLQMTVPESSGPIFVYWQHPPLRWTNCEDEGVKCPKTFRQNHERAWSSPIWL